MDVVFSRPHSFWLFDQWNALKKHSYERLRGTSDRTCDCNDPEPRSCEIDIEDCHRGLFPTQGLVNQLKQTSL